MKQIRRWALLSALVLLFAGCKADMPQAPAGEPADGSALQEASDTGVTIRPEEPVSADAEVLRFRIENGGDADYVYGYSDFRLQKKVGDTYQSVRWEGWVTAIGMIVHAGETCSESFPLAKYGIRLEAGETYRVGLSDHQSNGVIFSEEFTVEG